MTLDDETLLSAYLDDELDEARRLQVEEIVQEDPRLAQRLRDLALVRDLVAGMERPAPARDLSAPVLDWVCGRRPALPLRQRLAVLRPRRLLVTSSLTAAAVLIAASLALLNGPARSVPSPAGPVASPRLAEATAPAPAASPTTEAVATTAGASAPEPPARPAATELADLAATDPTAEDDRRFLRDLLRRPGVRRIVIGVDALEIDRAAGRVDAILRGTDRKQPRFGRLSVGQEIVLDPDEPGRAVVFAFVADDPERKLLVTQIQTQFGAGAEIEERPLDARVTTQLADAGSIAVFEGLKTPTLEPVRKDVRIALKDLGEEDSPGFHRGMSPRPAAEAAQGAAVTATAPARNRAGRPDVGAILGREAEPGALDTDVAERDEAVAGQEIREPMTVLVWVTARRGARSGPR